MNPKIMALKAIDILRADPVRMVQFTQRPVQTLECILGLDLSGDAASDLVLQVQNKLARSRGRRLAAES